MMDHTLLKAVATPEQIAQICEEAREIGAASVRVNPCNVRQAAELLKGSEVKVCTVIGFPLGANTPAVKAFETEDAIAGGAQEVDMVINVGALKAGDQDTVYRDIKAVVDAADGTLVKVIIETCYLTDAKNHCLPDGREGGSRLCQDLHRLWHRRRQPARRSADEGQHSRHHAGKSIWGDACMGRRQGQYRSRR